MIWACSITLRASYTFVVVRDVCQLAAAGLGMNVHPGILLGLWGLYLYAIHRIPAGMSREYRLPQ
ncbi:MAG: hypothetical protein GF398_11220 [Chitinivibrionales bacterium]|nr:hypothetical protein [Chitinivibrionales bacterium]